jgi:hypothetical protein
VLGKTRQIFECWNLSTREVRNGLWVVDMQKAPSTFREEEQGVRLRRCQDIWMARGAALGLPRNLDRGCHMGSGKAQSGEDGRLKNDQDHGVYLGG